jgi:hypothetical protein
VEPAAHVYGTSSGGITLTVATTLCSCCANPRLAGSGALWPELSCDSSPWRMTWSCGRTPRRWCGRSPRRRCGRTLGRRQT